MQMIYNSSNYCVVEFRTADDQKDVAGFEIMDKTQRREIYLDGLLAAHFHLTVQSLIKGQPDPDQVDAFLSQFTGMMHQPLTLH